MTRDELISSLRELLATDSDLAFLASVEASVLERLHDAVERSVRHSREAMDPVYMVMAQATRFIPTFVLVRLSRPLSAYVLAQSTMHLDSKSSAALGKAMGLERMASVQTEMIRMGAFEKIADISDYTAIDFLKPLAAHNGDPTHLAKIAMHMRDMKRVRAIFDTLSFDTKKEVLAHLQHAGRQDLASQIR